MQNQLNSLTAEQRANQAMNLLIYNTYTGPGTTAKVSTENPLNSFIQKELNQWAQNNLKGVDLSFGIDSYGEDDPNGQRTIIRTGCPKVSSATACAPSSGASSAPTPTRRRT